MLYPPAMAVTPVEHPSPLHGIGSSSVTLSHLSKYSPVSLRCPVLPLAPCSLRPYVLACPLPPQPSMAFLPLCPLRSSHFLRPSDSTAFSIKPSCSAEQLPFLVPSHIIWLVSLFNTIDNMFVDGTAPVHRGHCLWQAPCQALYGHYLLLIPSRTLEAGVLISTQPRKRELRKFLVISQGHTASRRQSWNRQ